MTSSDHFSSIPILNYALLSSPDTRAVFVQRLEHALVDVGFLYLEHPPVPDALFDDVISYLPRVFGLPQERKDALRMANSPHFLGYSRLGVEMTKGAADQREQFDIATPFEDRWQPGQPEYLRLWGPSQWPDEEDVPGFKATFLRYLFCTGLESVTQGLARATSHRVLAPAAGTSPRYSIPFFQNIRQDLRLSEHVLQLPPEALKLKGRRGELGQTDSVNFSEYKSLVSGQVSLVNRVKSHPDVAERHYPDLFKQFFPHGLPTHGTAY